MITTDQQSNHMFFYAGAKRWCAFHQPMADWSIMLSQNHFPEPNRHILTFFHPNFTMQDRKLSTAGDALRDKA
jgi:hypothetical protein